MSLFASKSIGNGVRVGVSTGGGGGGGGGSLFGLLLIVGLISVAIQNAAVIAGVGIAAAVLYYSLRPGPQLDPLPPEPLEPPVRRKRKRRNPS